MEYRYYHSFQPHVRGVVITRPIIFQVPPPMMMTWPAPPLLLPQPSNGKSLDVHAAPFVPEHTRKLFDTPAKVQFLSRCYHRCDNPIADDMMRRRLAIPLPLPTTRTGLEDFTHRALWRFMLHHEACAHDEMIAQWDMYDVELKLIPIMEPVYNTTRASHVLHGGEILATVVVPGVLEYKPALRFDDIILCRWNHDLDMEFQARVVNIYGDIVTIRLTSQIQHIFNMPRFAIRFPNYERHHFLRHMHCIVNDYVLRDKVNKNNTTMGQGRKEKKITTWFNPKLNTQQRRAVQGVMNHRNSASHPFVVFGPPGTGKSLTACEMVLQIFQTVRDSRILVCAPSDAACDVLAMRLLSQAPDNISVKDMLRVNPYKRSTKEVLDATNTLLRFCNVVAVNDGQPLTSSPFHEREFGLPQSDDVIFTQRILIMTTKMCGVLKYDRPNVLNMKFTHVIVDECSQALEPETMLPLSCAVDDIEHGIIAQRVLLGDPCQLPATVNFTHSTWHLETSLQENLMSTSPYSEQDPNCFQMLTQNYRSHQNLIDLSSELFYRGKLVSVAPVSLTNLALQWPKLPNPSFPAMFYNVVQANADAKKQLDVPTFENETEAILVRDLISDFVSWRIKTLQTAKTKLLEDMGVVALFRSQVLLIRKVLRAANLGLVKVGTVDDFQGQEVNCMFVSTTLPSLKWIEFAKSHPIYGHVRDHVGSIKRFNVAITRARALTVVVGNGSVMNEFEDSWGEWIKYCMHHHALAGQEMLELRSDIAAMERENLVKDIQEAGVWGRTAADMPIDTMDVYLREMYGGGL